MKWRKLRRLIRKHPYLIDKTYAMSMREARRLMRQTPHRPAEEILRAAMQQQSGIPESEWEPALRAASRRREQRARRKVWVPAAASLAAVVVFFSATPVGQAWAAEATRLVTRIFDGNIIVENMESAGSMAVSKETTPEELLPPAPAENNDGQEEITYGSFAELYEKTGLNPIMVGYEGYTVENITLYPNTATGTLLCVTYQNSKEDTLATSQSWSQEASEQAITIEENYFEKLIFQGKQSIYCWINEEERPKLFEGVAILEQEKIVFRIGFAADVPADIILESLQYYR